MKSKLVAALVVSAALIWGPAHAAPEPAEIVLEAPGVIVLQLEPIPGVEPGSEQEQAILNMLLLQVLGAMQAEGQNIEVEVIQPTAGTRI
jgi:hypothetical protein